MAAVCAMVLFLVEGNLLELVDFGFDVLLLLLSGLVLPHPATTELEARPLPALPWKTKKVEAAVPVPLHCRMHYEFLTRPL